MMIVCLLRCILSFRGSVLAWDIDKFIFYFIISLAPLEYETRSRKTWL